MALSVAAAALRANATRIGANISKRLTRLASKDVQGGDILVARLKAELEEIRAMPVTNYNEARSKEARMRHLNNAAGTKAETFQKAARRAYRDDLIAQTRDPNNILHMKRDELAEVYTYQRSRLRDRLRRVRQSIDGNNFMTRRAEQLLNLDVNGATVNQLRSFVGRSTKALDSDTLTVQGAKKQFQRGVEMFGDSYIRMTDEQRGAVWEAMRRQMSLGSIKSPDAIEVVRAVLEDSKWSAEFFNSETTGEMVAVIGQGAADTKARLVKAQIDDRNGNDILRRGSEKWGDKPEASLDYWTNHSHNNDYLF